jgi:hypothetical protein
MGLGKSVKRFFKKNLRDIVTVVGTIVLGPVLGPAAGAAIGQGIGSLAEGRSLKDSAISSAKIYGAGKIGEGAGWGQARRMLLVNTRQCFRFVQLPLMTCKSELQG